MYLTRFLSVCARCCGKSVWKQGLAFLLAGTVWGGSQGAELQPQAEAQQALTQALEEVRQQRYDQAEILLERVLMLQPENAEARIELALLMAHRGHTDGALALVQSLLDDPRTGPDHAQALRQLSVQLKKGQAEVINPYALGGRDATRRLSTLARQAPADAASEAPAASWRGEAGLTASTNPLARTASGAITITLPDGPLSLPLSQTAQSGKLLATSLSRTTSTHGAELSLQRTDVPGTTTAARALVWGQLPLTQWLPDGLQPQRWPAVLGYAQAQQGLDGQHRAMAGLTSVLGAQRLSLSHYEERSINDRGLVLRAEHSQPRWWGGDWQVSLERSNSTQGPQGYWRVGLSSEHGLGGGRKLLAQVTQQQDTYSYSNLLQSGAHRRLSTAYVAFEQHINWTSEKNLIWRVFSGERRSNIELFNYKDVGVQLSLAQNWR